MLSRTACNTFVDEGIINRSVVSSLNGEYLFKTKSINERPYHSCQKCDYLLKKMDIVYLIIDTVVGNAGVAFNIALTLDATMKGLMSMPMRFPPISSEEYPKTISCPVFTMLDQLEIKNGDVYLRGWFDKVVY